MPTIESKTAQIRGQAEREALRSAIDEDLETCEADLKQFAVKLRIIAESRVDKFVKMGLFDEAAKSSEYPENDWAGKPLLLVEATEDGSKRVYVDRIGWVWVYTEQDKRRNHLNSDGIEYIAVFPHILETLSSFLEEKE